MHTNRALFVCRNATFTHAILLAALTLAPVLTASAQSTTTPTETPACNRAHADEPTSTQTFFLKNIAQQNDANEILIALRNVLCPSVKVYFLASQNAIVMDATSVDLQLAQKLIDQLDRPAKMFRLTFAITPVEGSTRLPTQRYTMLLANGQRTTLKEGTKIPIMTKPASATEPSDVQYIDLGINLDATAIELADGAMLKAKVEQSSISDERSGIGSQDPIIRQTVLQDTTRLTFGKPLVLGTVAVPGSTQHAEIEVTLEPAS